MKKRFLLVLAAMLCLVMIAFAIPAMADSEPTTSIMGHNLALEDAGRRRERRACLEKSAG